MNSMRYQMTWKEGTATRPHHLFKKYNRSKQPHNKSPTQIIRRPQLHQEDSHELILSVAVNVSRSSSVGLLQPMGRPMHRSNRSVVVHFAAPAVTSESCASRTTSSGPITLTTFSYGTSIRRLKGYGRVWFLRPAMLVTPANANSYQSTTIVNGLISLYTCAGIVVGTDSIAVNSL